MQGKLPKHVAIIMDGNRRWAKEQKLPAIEGHRKGVESLVKTVELAGELGIKYLTVYALSSENFQSRSKEELSGLLQLLKEGFSKYLPRLKKNGVRLNFIGEVNKLPRSTQILIGRAKKELSPGKKGVLVVALNYSSRTEILQAAKKLKEKSLEYSEKNFTAGLYTSSTPDPGLLIRTGGQKRLSNFLLWQLSYSELYFTDTLWPAFDKKDFYKAISYFQSAKRNFGV